MIIAQNAELSNILLPVPICLVLPFQSPLASRLSRLIHAPLCACPASSSNLSGSSFSIAFGFSPCSLRNFSISLCNTIDSRFTVSFSSLVAFNSSSNCTTRTSNSFCLPSDSEIIDFCVTNYVSVSFIRCFNSLNSSDKPSFTSLFSFNASLFASFCPSIPCILISFIIFIFFYALFNFAINLAFSCTKSLLLLRPGDGMGVNCGVISILCDGDKTNGRFFIISN
eukprot:209352_1